MTFAGLASIINLRQNTTSLDEKVIVSWERSKTNYIIEIFLAIEMFPWSLS